jgi:hypothetical protein
MMKYIYFGLDFFNKTKINNGIVCVGYIFDLNAHVLRYSAAFCSPRDTFSRQKCHDILQKRMDNGKFRVCKNEKFNSLEREPLYQDCVQVIRDDFGTRTEKFFKDLGLKKCPYWFENLDKLELNIDHDIEYCLAWTVYDYIEIFQQNFGGEKTADGEEKYEKFCRGIRQIAKDYNFNLDKYDQYRLLLM